MIQPCIDLGIAVSVTHLFFHRVKPPIPSSMPFFPVEGMPVFQLVAHNLGYHEHLLRVEVIREKQHPAVPGHNFQVIAVAVSTDAAVLGNHSSD